MCNVPFIAPDASFSADKIRKRSVSTRVGISGRKQINFRRTSDKREACRFLVVDDLDGGYCSETETRHEESQATGDSIFLGEICR